jgi:hypothetical protein
LKIKCEKCGRELDGSPVPGGSTLGGGQNYLIKCPKDGELLVNHVANNPEAKMALRGSQKYLICHCGREVSARVATRSKEIGIPPYAVYTGECPDHGLLVHHGG